MQFSRNNVANNREALLRGLQRILSYVFSDCLNSHQVVEISFCYLIAAQAVFLVFLYQHRENFPSDGIFKFKNLAYMDF